MTRSLSSEVAGLSVDRTGPAQAPKIIAVHGFADDRVAFAPLAKTALTQSFELIAVDLPGFGHSVPPKGQGSRVNDLARILLDLADHISEASPVGLIGHSLGAPIAVQAARLAPHRIAGIVSLEGNLTEQDAYFSGQAVLYETAEQFKTAFLANLAEMAEQDPSLDRYLATIPQAQASSMWQLGRDAAALGRDAGFGDTYLGLAAIGVGSHYVWSRNTTPASTIEYLKAHTDLAQTELHDVGHWIAEDAPDVTAEIMLSLFKGLLDQDTNRV